MPNPSSDSAFSVHRYSTDDLPAPKRWAYWREVFAQSVIGTHVEPRSSAPLKAQILVQAMPGLRIVSLTSTPAHMTRTSKMAADGDDALVLLTPLNGELRAVQRDRDVTLAPGEAVLLRHGEAATVTHSRVRYQGFIVPRAPIAEALRDRESAVMRRIPADHGVLRPLLAYARAIPGQFGSTQGGTLRLMASHVHDLVAAVAGNDREDPGAAVGGGLRVAQLHAVKADVIAGIGHGDVTISRVAARQRITSRTIQRLFEEDGSTFSAFKLEQQLTYARRLLHTSVGTHRTIADLAYAAGFSDVSYFHRTFRRRFGATPSEFREARGNRDDRRPDQGRSGPWPTT
jgi:AraC-like DNA-binding protein